MCRNCRYTVAIAPSIYCTDCDWLAALGELVDGALRYVFARTRQPEEQLLLTLDAIAHMLTDHAEAKAELRQALSERDQERGRY
jgi:hypothetical protein